MTSRNENKGKKTNAKNAIGNLTLVGDQVVHITDAQRLMAQVQAAALASDQWIGRRTDADKRATHTAIVRAAEAIGRIHPELSDPAARIGAVIYLMADMIATEEADQRRIYETLQEHVMDCEAAS